MTVSDQLIAHIRDTAVPDKNQILRMRALARELAGAIPDRVAAKALVQRLNGAYLVLQLAALSDDPQASETYRRECSAIVRAMDRAALGEAADAPSDAPSDGRVKR